MALTGDVSVEMQGVQGMEFRMPIANGAQLYRGGLVAMDTSTGRAVAASDAASRMFMGIAVRFEADGALSTGLGNSAGTQYVMVVFNRMAKMKMNTDLQTNAQVGLNVFIEDDEQVCGAGTVTNDVRVGELIRIDDTDSTMGWIWLRRFAHNDAT